MHLLLKIYLKKNPTDLYWKKWLSLTYCLRCGKKRAHRKKIKVSLAINYKENKTLPVYKYYEHNEILEEMAKEALKVLDSDWKDGLSWKKYYWYYV